MLCYVMLYYVMSYKADPYSDKKITNNKYQAYNQLNKSIKV